MSMEELTCRSTTRPFEQEFWDRYALTPAPNAKESAKKRVSKPKNKKGAVVSNQGYDPFAADIANERRLVKLEAFYKAIIQLTVNHDTLESTDSGMSEDYAVVFPNKLSKELEKIDPEWYKNA